MPTRVKKGKKLGTNLKKNIHGQFPIMSSIRPVWGLVSAQNTISIVGQA
ncbi:MAG TPA: hypothetical protein VFR94_10220 [Nitrososphaeraceae archaeon]|nr:hypothetical protein [Nitrososphaeraceae archaeon]